jgi:hypothetical protein
LPAEESFNIGGRHQSQPAELPDIAEMKQAAVAKVERQVRRPVRIGASGIRMGMPGMPTQIANLNADLAR